MYLCAEGKGDAFHDEQEDFFFKGGRAVELTSRDGKEIIELIADKLPVAKHSNRR